MSLSGSQCVGHSDKTSFVRREGLMCPRSRDYGCPGAVQCPCFILKLWSEASSISGCVLGLQRGPVYSVVVSSTWQCASGPWKAGDSMEA